MKYKNSSLAGTGEDAKIFSATLLLEIQMMAILESNFGEKITVPLL